MRLNGHPSRPSAITCCRFSSLKTLLTSMEGISIAVNVLLQLRWPVFSRPSLAGFDCPPRTSPLPGNNTYTNYLPSVQLSYRIGGNTQIRVAYGMGVARPNFGDLPPYLVENQSRKSVSAGNPNRKATRANNFGCRDHLLAKNRSCYLLFCIGLVLANNSL